MTKNSLAAKSAVCPTCGTCPTCGRRTTPQTYSPPYPICTWAAYPTSPQVLYVGGLPAPWATVSCATNCDTVGLDAATQSRSE